MNSIRRFFVMFLLGISLSSSLQAQTLPFSYKVETYRNQEGDVVAFALKLEQPFLAEEFEKSNYLRLASLDDKSYLIYPKETKFRQKHAEFYGRMRGIGKAKIRLAYETVSENLDGSRKTIVRNAEIEVPIPDKPTGIESIYKQWAGKQNEHFADLLQYYPETSFFEYVLLQSRARYGVRPPQSFSASRHANADTETGLYHTFSGGLALQQSLQYQTLATGRSVGDLSIHISQLQPPRLRSPNYDELLEKSRAKNTNPRVHPVTKLIPYDQYLLHFNSMKTANELMELSKDWGENLLRLFTVNARDPHLQQKYEDQLCVRRGPLTQLFADKVITGLTATGSDFFIAEGTDLTLIFELDKPEVFHKVAAGWLEQVQEHYPELQIREFNYRGHKVAARYTADRMVSSFVVNHENYAIFSNSHVAIRKVIDTMIGKSPSLNLALDYQYITTILPPADDENSAYLYGSDALLRRLVSPEFKIAEKRRLEAFNHLVMLNNASMFYRLEHGKSPNSLSDLVEGKFVSLGKIVDPTGGAYAFDAIHDTATSSLYNRIKYLTPILELNVLKVSKNESKEYDRYKNRYESFWQNLFDPVAIRITTGKRVKLETCVLPFANSGIYRDLRAMMDDTPQQLSAARVAKSAIASMAFVPGRKRISEIVRAIPAVTEALADDPTLTDLTWLGDRMSLHFLDDDTILEIDPTRLRKLQMFGNIPVAQQAFVASAIAATNLPLYFTIDVEDEGKAERLLNLLGSRIFLKGGNLFSLDTKLDSYRLPDYKNRKLFALSYQLYAFKIRFYVSLVNGQLIAATKPHALREAIDAANNDEADSVPAHALLRFNLRAMDKMKNDVQIYWGERLRQAAHRNIMPIYNLIKLYNVPIEDVNKLADAKYGVTYFCPGGGEYRYDKARDQVFSTVYGNRRNARQPLTVNDNSEFARFFNSLDEITASLRFIDDGLIATVEIEREEE